MMTATDQIRVMCVDDHAFLVEGLRARISAEQDMEFVGALHSLDRITEKVESLEPSVVLMDIEVPGADVFEVISDLSSRVPGIRFIVLSAHVRDHYIDSALHAGASGYLSKGDDPSIVVDAIRRVARGEQVFGPQVLERINALRKAQSGGGSRLQSLTPREQQILRMIGKGQSRTEIAKTIHRSPKTVDAHRASIMEKLGIHDRVELARYAIREGLVEV